MRTYLTLAAAAVTGGAVLVSAPAAAPATRHVAARGAAPAAVPDRALLDSDPVLVVADLPDVGPMLDAEPLVLPDPEHGSATHSHAASAPRATPRRLAYGRWRTPEAAMRHLARAYNAKDAGALKDVTTPSARTMLNDMRRWAPDLRLVACTDTKAGGFDCSFTHAFAKAPGRGTAVLRVNPARTQGWYATLVVECG